jgi:ABC-type transporter Mla subunit MlaD
MKDITTDSITKMNSGADTLYVAATDFAKAGKGVSDTMDKSNDLAERLREASLSITSASTSLSSVVSDYKNSRDTVTQLVGSLNLIIENAKKDASLTSDVIKSIEMSTSKLIEAQKQADSYLDEVSNVIEVSHESFSQGMVKVVGEANRDFHSALSSSVKLLRETIGELEATFDSISNRK